MGNEIKTGEKVAINPQELGKNSAENFILNFQIDEKEDRYWLGTKETLTKEQFQNTQELLTMSQENQNTAALVFWDRMSEAQKFLGPKFWERRKDSLKLPFLELPSEKAA